MASTNNSGNKMDLITLQVDRFRKAGEAVILELERLYCLNRLIAMKETESFTISYHNRAVEIFSYGLGGVTKEFEHSKDDKPRDRENGDGAGCPDSDRVGHVDSGSGPGQVDISGPYYLPAFAVGNDLKGKAGVGDGLGIGSTGTCNDDLEDDTEDDDDDDDDDDWDDDNSSTSGRGEN